MSVRSVLLIGAFLVATPALRSDDFFETKVRPVLAERCFKCHGEKQQKGGIRLDGPEGFRTSDGSGPIVVPGKPNESRLIKAIHQTGEVKMPPNGKLPADAVRALEDWVKAGAKWPEKVASRQPGADHWAFKAVRPPAVPAVKDQGWPSSPLDNFVLAKLEAKGLKPSPAADRRTLIRRVHFDLTGLPPSAEVVDAFVKDGAPDAYEKVVDRLLASPQFGERWGRHFLDVARYSDTKGAIGGEDARYPFAYTYRDWVVKAFNDDLPYDQFLIKQIAGDHLTRIENHPDLAALGFLTLGRKFENSDPDIIADRLDVIFRGTQGLSVACARCHDHKYDPIPIKDYYSLYGVFADTRETDVPLITTAEDRLKYQAYAAELRARVRSFGKFVEVERKRVFGSYRQQADRYLLAAQAGGGEPKEGTAREDGLNQVLVSRYAEELQSTKAEHNPIFAPWHAFAALKSEQFATQAKKLARGFAANDEPEKPLNSLVAHMFAGKPPTNLEDVASRYGRLLSATARKWEKKIAAADRIDVARPTALEDDDEEAIRQLLFDDGPLEISAGDLPTYIGEEKSAKFTELQNRITEWQNGPEVPPHARVIEDPSDLPAQTVFVRGKPEQPGEEVPRQFLAVLAGKDRKPFTDGTGRLELARAIANKDNPLTARVWSNRVWAHLFGRGIVETTSDFGLRSTPPTHPELLDFLASSLTENGWSTKQLIRLIVLSNTYRQGSADRPDVRKVDPTNSLIWRMNRKRVEVEALRDSLLATAGNLDATVGGRAVDSNEQPLSHRRAIYLLVDRGNLPGLFRVYDFANPDMHAPGRYETTVPLQALFLLNSPFTHEQARGVARRSDDTKPPDDRAWVRAAYRTALGRDPSAEEVALGVKFLSSAAAVKTIGPQQVPVPWRYGYGKWDGAKKRLAAFTALSHFQDDQWRAGPEYPDAKLGYVALSAEGGHPGENRDTVAVRRWVAPADGTVSIEGVLKHELPEDEKPEGADGVKGYVVAGNKVVAQADVFNKETPTNAAKIVVKAGEVIDFVVDPKANNDSDTFSWRVDISFAPAGKPGAEIGFNSAEDFRGPPAPTGAPLTPKEKFAQVLLMSNEFLYVD
jgi:hypothetical protein